jgi:hypothetical protein
MSFSLKNLYINFGASVGVVQMPNYNEFTALFQQYRIANIELLMFFNRNADSTATGGATLPLVAFVKDYTNATAPGSLSDLLQYENVELKQFGNARGESPAVRIQIRPRVAIQVNDYGTFPAAVAAEEQWYDTAFPDTPFYGVKGWYDNQTTGAGTTPVGTVSLYCKATYQFKQPI